MVAGSATVAIFISPFERRGFKRSHSAFVLAFATATDLRIAPPDQATEWKRAKYSIGSYNRRYLFGKRVLAAGFSE
jgi:hypothetical protein